MIHWSQILEIVNLIERQREAIICVCVCVHAGHAVICAKD